SNMPSMYSYLSTRFRNLFATSSKSSMHIAAAYDLLYPPYVNIELADRMLASRLFSSGALPKLEQEIEAYISMSKDFLATGVDEYFILDPETRGYTVNLRGLKTDVWRYGVWFATIENKFDSYLNFR
ncbi:hypothetical protein RUND412_007522, partial [Rhizina undulata]